MSQAHAFAPTTGVEDHGGPQGQRRRRVFLCDDDSAYRALARAVLEPSGSEVVGEAAGAEECLARIGAAQPDVLLLDENMPRMKGSEALPLIRSLMPDMTVILLTTAPCDDLDRRVRAGGARACVRKPTDIFRLPDALREALDG